MTAPTPRRRQYMRDYKRNHRPQAHTLFVDDIGIDLYELLQRYRRESGMALKRIVTEALSVYLAPRLK